MGLFDSIAGQAIGAMTGQNNGAQSGITEVVAGLIAGQGVGGLPGLLAAFEKNGLGAAVASWIGTGQNLPISADQLQSVLGSAQVQAIAQKLGLSSGEAATALAGFLPQFIDRLTPNGQLPNVNLAEQGLALLRGFGNHS